jgi:two-component system, NarL family, nitrate/nitrite response regulator NarL
MDKIRLVIVDDHPLFREGVVAILGTEPNLEFVGQGATAEEAMHLAYSFLPDIIILDINMPGGGINAVQSIADSLPTIKTMILTGSNDDDDVLNALQAGARAFVLKGVTARELVDILHRVQNGERYVTPSLVTSLHLEIRPSAQDENNG